jgi:Ca2+ transporting ATPase
MLWINLIMDTLASLALATEDPHENVLLRKPYSRDDYIVSKSMKKNIIGQSLFQIAVLVVLIFWGETFIPEEADALDDQQIYIDNLHYKWYNGEKGGTVCSGRFYNISGGDDYYTAFEATHNYSRHFTFIFNAFVLMQVFNFINARKIHEEVAFHSLRSMSSRGSSSTRCSALLSLAYSSCRPSSSPLEGSCSEFTQSTA